MHLKNQHCLNMSEWVGALVTVHPFGCSGGADLLPGGVRDTPVDTVCGPDFLWPEAELSPHWVVTVSRHRAR